MVVLSPVSACVFNTFLYGSPAQAGSPILSSSRYEADLHELREYRGKSMLLQQRVANTTMFMQWTCTTHLESLRTAPPQQDACGCFTFESFILQLFTLFYKPPWNACVGRGVSTSSY